MTDRRDLVTRDGQTLPLRLWALLRDAYEEAGLDPAKYLVVVQGSYNPGGVDASGTTHAKGGAFDLRVWNLPSLEHRNKIVRALRRRNVAAWERSSRTGSWSKGDHLHGIVMDEPDLSSGAEWQKAEFLAGRDGLSRRGKDYHPRPRRWRFRKVRLSNVKPGARNADVLALQTRLRMPTRLRTGYYGPATRAAVAARWPLSKGVVRPRDLRRLCFWVTP